MAACHVAIACHDAAAFRIAAAFTPLPLSPRAARHFAAELQAELLPLAPPFLRRFSLALRAPRAAISAPRRCHYVSRAAISAFAVLLRLPLAERAVRLRAFADFPSPPPMPPPGCCPECRLMLPYAAMLPLIGAAAASFFACCRHFLRLAAARYAAAAPAAASASYRQLLSLAYAGDACCMLLPEMLSADAACFS